MDKEDRLQRIKERHKFRELPREDKPLIAGFRFLLGDYPSLKQWTTRSNTVHFSGEPWVHRVVVLEKEENKSIFKIDIFLAQKRSLDVHEALFESYLNYAHEYTRLRGEDYGIRLGDFCLLSKFNDNILGVDFVRNNVAVGLVSYGQVDFDLVDLAKQMDEALKAELTLSVLERSGKTPIIEKFSSSEERIKPGEKTKLQISAADPIGEELLYEFEVPSGSVNWDPKQQEYYYRAGGELGIQTIILHVINERNLLASSQIQIMVIKAGR
ncbi:MAG: hypothetical protein AYK19_04110 [Theionarchaea archaeon DG-70-1]|nr:MAG: hypothetical protein AYK19_04110 [Theionarchaea archaeon DG-70-1]